MTNLPKNSRAVRAALSGLMAIVLWFPAASPSVSGEWVKAANKGSEGCILKLEGPVERGDAQALQKATEDYRAHLEEVDPYYYMGDYPYDSVCLNSEGGAFSEGVKLAEFLNTNGYGTVVEPGDKCFSACAIAFMGGSYHSEDDRGTQPKRVLYPTSRLGFHSPSLNLPKNQYSEAIVSDAYAAALLSIAKLQQISHDIRFPRSLLVNMLETPPEQMLIVDTVEQAARWRMIVGGVDPIREMQAIHLQNACNNVDSGLLDTSTIWHFTDLGEWSDGYKLTREDGGWWGGSFVGYRQELATPCTIYYSSTVSEDGFHPSLIQGDVELVNWVDLYAYQLFSPETKLSDLPMHGE